MWKSSSDFISIAKTDTNVGLSKGKISKVNFSVAKETYIPKEEYFLFAYWEFLNFIQTYVWEIT